MEFEHSAMMMQEFCNTQYLLRQPHVYLKAEVYQDGDMWCCLYGESLMRGVSAFGKTPKQAAEAFDLVWLNGDAKETKEL